MTTKRRALGQAGWVLALALAGCGSTHPLGRDWRGLDAGARTERACAVLSELFASGVDGNGQRFEDRQVIHCSPAGIAWETGDGARSELSWADVQAVESTRMSGLPARPETVFVYLSREADSRRQVADLVTPALASVGLARPYVLLRSRPRWARGRLVRALAHLERTRADAPPDGMGPKAGVVALLAGPEGEAEAHAGDAAEATGPAVAPGAAEAPGEAAATPADPPAPGSFDAIEAKLERLRSWRDQGLIDEAEYEAKKQELLEAL